MGGLNLELAPTSRCESNRLRKTEYLAHFLTGGADYNVDREKPTRGIAKHIFHVGIQNDNIILGVIVGRHFGTGKEPKTQIVEPSPDIVLRDNNTILVFSHPRLR